MEIGPCRLEHTGQLSLLSSNLLNAWKIGPCRLEHTGQLSLLSSNLLNA